MKLEKFMTEVTKAILKDNNKVLFWEYGDRVVITHNGFFAMIIPKKRNIFNHEIFKNQPIPCDWNSNKLIDTEQLRKIGKKTVHIFETEKGEKVQIDEKYLNYFDGRAEFYGKHKTAVIVSEDGGKNPCGVIMPIVK